MGCLPMRGEELIFPPARQTSNQLLLSPASRIEDRGVEYREQGATRDIEENTSPPSYRGKVGRCSRALPGNCLAKGNGPAIPRESDGTIGKSEEHHPRVRSRGNLSIDFVLPFFVFFTPHSRTWNASICSSSLSLHCYPLL